jgi:hypothetical protein
MKLSCYGIHLNNCLQLNRNAALQSCCVFSLSAMSIKNRGGNTSASPATVTSVALCVLKRSMQALRLFVSLCVRSNGSDSQPRVLHCVGMGEVGSARYVVATGSHSQVCGQHAGVALNFEHKNSGQKKEVERLRALLHIWCPEEDSNLHTLRHTDLNRARLPIPPSGLHLQGAQFNC